MSWLGLCYVDENMAIINEVAGRPDTALNLGTYYVSNNAQRWVLNLPLEPALTFEAGNRLGPAFAQMMASNYADPIVLPMPQVVAQATVRVDGTGAAGSTAVRLSARAAIQIGRFIKFGNHSKVYIVRHLNDQDLVVYPQLRKAINNSEIDIEPDFSGRQVSDQLSATINRKVVRLRLRLAEIV